MKFCAVKRGFLGGFFLKFFGIFREKLFFCVFSLLFLSLTDVLFLTESSFFIFPQTAQMLQIFFL